MQIGDTIAATFDGIKLDMSPMVVLTPGFVNQIETKVFSTGPTSSLTSPPLLLTSLSLLLYDET